jgi:hypothetical protein
MGPTRQQLIAIKNQSGVGEGDPPPWKQYGMTDLIANAIVDRDSLAYYDVFSMVYGVDEFRRAKYGELGWLAKIEEAGTRLTPNQADGFDFPYGGTALGDVFTENTASGGHGIDDSPAQTITTGDKFTMSMDIPAYGRQHGVLWLGDGSGRNAVIYWDAAAGTTVQQRVVGTHWVLVDHGIKNGRIYLVAQAATNMTTLSSRVYLDDGTNSPDVHGAPQYMGDGTQTLLSRVQTEKNPYPTSWIPGPGTARAADDVETSVITQSKGLLLLPFRKPYALTGSEQFRLYEASGGAADLLVAVNPTGTIVAQIEGAPVGGVSTPSVTVTDWNIYGYAWNNGTARVFLNGTKEITASVADPIGSGAAFLYHGPFSADRYLNGVGGAFQREGYSFTDDQITAISDDLLARLPT